MLFYVSINDTIENQIAIEAQTVCNLTASRDDIIKGFLSPLPRVPLGQIADDIMLKTNAAFIVFLDNASIRHTHPNPSLIGERFTGEDEYSALQEGKSYTSKAVGISGKSIRAFAPIYDYDGNQLGAMVVGFWQPEISMIIWNIFEILYIIIPVSILLIAVTSLFLSYNIKELLFGMEPSEIATKLKEHEIMMETVREGVIAIDADSKITVANSAARKILHPKKKIIGQNVRDVIPNTRLDIVLKNNSVEYDEYMLLNGHRVLVNRIPLVVDDVPVGAITTFRDMTELNNLAEELTGAKQLVESLRAKSHEFMNKLQAISGLIQLEEYAEVRKYVLGITAKEQSFIEFLLNNIKNPATAGLLEGKSSEARERKISLRINPRSTLDYLPHYFDEHAMLIVLGNLIDNSMDAVQKMPPEKRNVEVLILQDENEILIEVADTGDGISDDIINQMFERGFSTKELGRGYGLFNVKTRIDLALGKIRINCDEMGTKIIINIPIY